MIIYNMSAAPSFRQQSTDTISSHDSYDFNADDYDPFEDAEPPKKHVSKVKGYHPNRAAATKIQSLHRGKKGRDRAEIMRNAQANEAMFNLADIDSILKELEDCHSEKARLEEQLEQYEGERKGGKRRRRKTRRKTRRKKSKSKRKTKRRRKSSKRRRR